MTIKALLFDIDGTLVDSNEFHVTAWDEAFRSVGAHFARQQIHDQIGKGTDNLVPTLLPGSTVAEQKQLGDLHGRIFRSKYLPIVRPFPAARELHVRALNNGMRLAWASSASQQELDHYLDLLDARTLVTVTTTADDVEHTKPAPDIFETALAKLAPLNPRQVIAIGDTPYDVAAAGKCGIATIALRSGGFSDAALRSEGPKEIADDVAALLETFDTCFAA